MKNQREFIKERVDELALKHHGHFYLDLHPSLKQSIWSMATREYSKYCSDHIKNTKEALGGKG